MSVLYVVATPIGNLEDLSPRAQNTLKEADLILAEDTRVTRGLLSAFHIKTPLESHHLHNERANAQRIVARMLEEKLSVALVSDAGTPAISDPGAYLVGLAREAGIPVVAVPGPSALTAALSLSGFEEGEFTFYGFLPRKKAELAAKLQSMRSGAPLAVLYEAPHRMQALLEAVTAVYPGIRLSVSRELSKLHEQTITGTIEEVARHFMEHPGQLRGEFVVILRLPDAPEAAAKEEAPASPEARLVDLLARGYTLRDAQAELVLAGSRKNAVYAAALRLKELARGLLSQEEQAD